MFAWVGFDKSSISARNLLTVHSRNLRLKFRLPQEIAVDFVEDHSCGKSDNDRILVLMSEIWSS